MLITYQITKLRMKPKNTLMADPKISS